MSNDETAIPVLFSTNTQYPLPSQKFMIPVTWRRYQLSQLINKALSLPKPVPFDFLVRGEMLRVTLREWCTEKGVAEEETLEIEYIESVLPPERISSLPHDDWVSSISCQVPGYFFTASYDGCVRVFDHSQKVVNSSTLHSAPITSFCLVPSTPSQPGVHTIATASHDLTVQLTRMSLSDHSPDGVEPLATCHLHTAPVSSVASDVSGSRLLTSSWDGLIGLWDASVPVRDEVPLEEMDVGERKKKRRVDLLDQRPKRKAPLAVLKSHTARVSRVVFGRGDATTAYSCGFDSTIRTWDVENGVCTSTINAPEKPMLDLAVMVDGRTAVVASTDRTVSVYDLRESTTNATMTNAAVAGLVHPATPSCIALTGSVHRIVSGAYDGGVRIWDLRSAKSAMTSFNVWGGAKKVLSVDWASGVVGVGGEGGVEIWRTGEGGGRGAVYE